MTEKRFMASINNNVDVDYDVEIWDYNKHLDPSEVVDLMNELNEKNHNLRESRRELITANNQYRKKLNELNEENKELKSKFKSEEVDLDYVLCLLKRTIGELKYFIKDYGEDEIDITVHNLIRDVDLFLGDKQDIFSGYISYIIDCKEYLEKENEELKHDLKLLQDILWTTDVIRNLEKENEQLKERITDKNIETEIEIGKYIEKVLKVIDEENEKYWLKEKTSLRKEAKIYNSFRRSLTKIGMELF